MVKNKGSATHEVLPQESRYSEITKMKTLTPPDPDMIDGNSLSGGHVDQRTEIAAIQSARRVVESILAQITLHDSPPINEKVFPKTTKQRAEGVSRYRNSAALSCPSESSTASSDTDTLQTTSLDIDETLAVDPWNPHFKVHKRAAETKLGHAALVGLCQRTLEATAPKPENEENVQPQPARFKPNLRVNTNIIDQHRIEQPEEPPLLGESLIPLSPLVGLSLASKRESFGDPPALELTSRALSNEVSSMPTPVTVRSRDEIRRSFSDDSTIENPRRVNKDPPLVDCRDPTPTFERSHDVDFAEDLPLVQSLSSEDDVLDYPPLYPGVSRANALSDIDLIHHSFPLVVPSKNLSGTSHVPRLQMFGSEYARYLSETPLAPSQRKSIMAIRPPRHSSVHHRSAGLDTARVLTLENANSDIKTGAITDIVITRGTVLPPKGYYRISQGVFGEESGSLERLGRELHINVKKEPKWDRAAQRPCVTALTVIYPDRNEFVPPGFCVVSFHEGGDCARVSKLSASNPANLSVGINAERIFLCYRRSREGNPLTGLITLIPSRFDNVPEGYTVLERSPRNHVAAIECGGNLSVFLAYRQRLATLEPLRPLPLLLSIYRYAAGKNPSFPCQIEHEIHNNSSSFRKVKLHSYYGTGGTAICSDVGKFHIMDRSTHGLLSPSSIKNRLALIQASRSKGSHDGCSTVANTYLDEIHSVNNTFSGSNSIQTHSEGADLDDDGSLGDGSSFHTLSSTMSQCLVGARQQRKRVSSTLFTADDLALQHCLSAMAFIPVVESPPPCGPSDFTLSLELRTAIITPILTACYTQHGGSSMLAVKGLDLLLDTTDFFLPDISSALAGNGSDSRLTLLDLAIQSVCDNATSSARETGFMDCVDFVRKAVSCSRGHLNGRTIGYVLRFYLFVFYFGASVPTTSTSPNTVWPTLSHKGNASRSAVATKDVPFLFEETESDYLPGGAPQAAALATKSLVALLMNRLVELTHTEPTDQIINMDKSDFEPGEFGSVDPSIPLDDHIVYDEEVRRIDLANFAQLALHQIHRSGGSELFWHDMMTCCGSGLFENIRNLGHEGKSAHMIAFSLLANLVKSSSGRMRHFPKTGCLIPRDVASKMLSLEMLRHYLVTFRDCAFNANLVDDVRTLGHQQICSVTLIYAMRRLVVPCILGNTVQGLQDARVYRRLFHIISEVWDSPIFRQRMKLELGVLMDQFVLKVLNLGPQLLSPQQALLQRLPRSDSVQQADTGLEQFTEPLFNHQVDLLFELKKWFQGDSRSLVEFFLNFDTDISLQNDGPSHLMPGSQWKLCERLCEAICAIAEQSGSIIANQIIESHATSQGAQIIASTSLSDEVSKSSTLGDDTRMNPFATVPTARFASRHLQECSFAAAVEVSSCLSMAAATAAGREETKIVRRKHLGDKDINFDGDAYKPPTNLRSKSMSTGSREGDQSILSYWRTAIAAERNRGVSSRGKAFHSMKSSGSDSRSLSTKDGTWEQSSASHGATEEVLRTAFLIVESKSLKSGIEYLTQQDFLSPAPPDVATFLRVHNNRFNATSLGEYLGEGGIDEADSEYLSLVRFNYVRAISFVGMTVEQGLRHFLTNCGFRLPGEAQQIDRIMTTFSQCYWEDNAGDYYRCPFDDQDTVFLLSFAIIMLNTDLHKQSAISKNRARRHRKTMTKTEFLINLRDVARDDALSQDYLSAIYDSVEACPIELFEEAASNAAPTKTSTSDSIVNGVCENVKLVEGLHAILKNVKKSEELLRGLSVHDFRFYTIEDYAEYIESSKMEALMDLSHSAFACTWVYFHRLIKATVNIAHLDPQAVALCLPLLLHCLCATICFDMMKEFRSFALHLARLKAFAENATIAAPSFHTEEWFIDLTAALDQRDKPTALEQVQELMDELEERFKVDSHARKQMARVVRRIQDGQFLLNDPTRFFRKEGFLQKKSHRTGRSTKYHFFLFSDLLLYTKPAVVSPGTEMYYLIHEVLALPTMTIVDWYPNSKKSTEKSFSIHHPRKSFTVVCNTVDERKGWVEDIRKCIRESQRRLVQLAEAGRSTVEPPVAQVVQDITKPPCL